MLHHVLYSFSPLSPSPTISTQLSLYLYSLSVSTVLSGWALVSLEQKECRRLLIFFFLCGERVSPCWHLPGSNSVPTGQDLQRYARRGLKPCIDGTRWFVIYVKSIWANSLISYLPFFMFWSEWKRNSNIPGRPRERGHDRSSRRPLRRPSNPHQRVMPTRLQCAASATGATHQYRFLAGGGQTRYRHVEDRFHYKPHVLQRITIHSLSHSLFWYRYIFSLLYFPGLHCSSPHVVEASWRHDTVLPVGGLSARQGGWNPCGDQCAAPASHRSAGNLYGEKPLSSPLDVWCLVMRYRRVLCIWRSVVTVLVSLRLCVRRYIFCHSFNDIAYRLSMSVLLYANSWMMHSLHLCLWCTSTQRRSLVDTVAERAAV